MTRSLWPDFLAQKLQDASASTLAGIADASGYDALGNPSVFAVAGENSNGAKPWSIPRQFLTEKSC